MMAVVDVGGVGYEVRVPLSTLEVLEVQKDVFLYTHLVVREDDLKLFGFATIDERRLFTQILGISGVGPAIALAALSALSPSELASAIVREDARALQRIKGVGKRLAERLIVELKDRIRKVLDVDPASAGEGSAEMAARGAEDDAVSALVALGYSLKDAEARVSRAAEGVKAAGGELSVELLVRDSLR